MHKLSKHSIAKSIFLWFSRNARLATLMSTTIRSQIHRLLEPPLKNGKKRVRWICVRVHLSALEPSY